MLVSALAYSMFTVFGKNALEVLTPNQVMLWRFLMAVPIAWAIILVRSARGGPRIRDVEWLPRFAAGRVFGMAAWFGFAGLSRLSGALYIVVIYTYPAMVAVGSWLLGKPAPRHVWIAVFIIMVGIALTVPEIFGDGNRASVVGLVYTLANAVAYAAYVIYSERLVGGDRPADGLIASAWSFTGSLAAAVIVAFVNRTFTGPTTFDGWSAMVGLSTISTVLAGMAFFMGVRHLGPSHAALIASTEPVLTLVWVVVILDETLKGVQFIGAVLVIIGVMWSQRPEKSVNPPEPAVRPPTPS